MKLIANNALQKELDKILQDADKLELAVDEDKEVDMNFLQEFRDRAYRVRNGIHKWQAKVEKHISATTFKFSTESAIEARKRNDAAVIKAKQPEHKLAEDILKPFKIIKKKKGGNIDGIPPEQVF